MDFKDRLQKAVERGKRVGDDLARARQLQAMTEEEHRRLHAQYRLELSDHIESCLREIPTHFPGFRWESVSGDKGWGAAVFRDDLSLEGGRRATLYSRLEIAVRPYTSAYVLELVGKGTVRNKEIFSRTHYQELQKVDLAAFANLVDLWVLEYAELYAQKA